MKRCMIIDDSGVIRKVAKRILTSIDFKVTEASTGHGALSLCRGELPDVIILDCALPDLGTVEFLRQLSAIPGAARPQVVLLMAEFDIGTFMRAKRAGAHGYLLKPFNRTHILERFRQLKMAA